MRNPARIATATIGVATPIAIFAPVERLGDEDGSEVVELVLIIVAELVENIARDKTLVNAVRKDRVGVKSFNIWVSVLCHRT